MPANIVPADPNNGMPSPYQPGGAAWAPQPPMAPASSTLGEQLGRFTSAIKRYKWLIVAEKKAKVAEAGWRRVASVSAEVGH